MSIFVVALAAEARPLIDALKLKRQIDKPWQLYSNGEQHVLLTGMGKLNAAAACAWLIGHNPLLGRQPWINIGIAGHENLDIGTLHWVERLQQESGDLYPALHSRCALPGSALLTLDAPCTEYPASTLVDMEGLGFYLSCSKFVPLELIHLLKVVSDNQCNPIETLNKSVVTELLHKRCEDILLFAESLSELAKSLSEAAPAELEQCMHSYLNTWRFSHNQSQQLSKLLQRFFTLTGQLPQASDFSPRARDAKQVLAQLDIAIKDQPVMMQ